jgi:hypothetical protein
MNTAMFDDILIRTPIRMLNRKKVAVKHQKNLIRKTNQFSAIYTI